MGENNCIGDSEEINDSGCRVRSDFLLIGLKVPVVAEDGSIIYIGENVDYEYRWLGEDPAIFQVKYEGTWYKADAVDFDF